MTGRRTSASRSANGKGRRLDGTGKPSSHQVSDPGKKRTKHILSSSMKPTIEITSLSDEVEFISVSMSKTRFVVSNTSSSIWLLYSASGI